MVSKQEMTTMRRYGKVALKAIGLTTRGDIKTYASA